MMSNDEKLEGLHKISMALLKEADKAMKEENCLYMLDAGTLLGAIRHRGFIPWDDDADICMMREEYDKFLKCAKKHFSGDFEFILPGKKGDNKFYDFVPKIICKKAVVDKGSEDYKFYDGKYSYPALDIFVIDKVPDSKIGQLLHTKLLIFIYGLAMGHRRNIDYSKYSMQEGVVIRVLSAVGKIIPLHVTARMYDKAACMFMHKNKAHVMSTHSAMDHFGDVYKYDWYKEISYGIIEGEKFPVPFGYHEILTKHYKDYMALPPICLRKPKHLDFDKVEFL
ncbi:MAG: phosphorylcholine transferase LicD [Clostridia bacterium]